MIGLNSFFSNFATQYIAKYQARVVYFNIPRPTAIAETPTNSLADTSQPADTHAAPSSANTSVEPAPNAISTAPETTTPTDSADITPASEKPTTETTESALYTQLRYKLRMQFDLRALEETAVAVAHRGDKTHVAIESAEAGSFGLHVDFALAGLRVQKTVTEQGSPDTPVNPDEIAATAAKLNAGQKAAYSTAVNRFAMRYRSDSQFAFSNFSRFQGQIHAVREKDSSAVTPYAQLSGDLASGATNDTMAQFFDAVDSYLEQNEQSLTEVIEKAFASAQKELGMSESVMTSAAQQLKSLVSGFFDRAQNAVAILRDRFAAAGNNSIETPPTQPAEIDTTVAAPVADSAPVVVPQQLIIDPQVEALHALLATLESDTPEPTPARIAGEAAPFKAMA